MAPFKHPIAVVGSYLNPSFCPGEMKLSYETTVIPGVRQHLCNKGLSPRKKIGSVPVHMMGGRILAREKCSSTRCADGTLGVRPGKRRAHRCEPVDIRSTDVLIPQAPDSVVPLLVAAIPQYIRSFHTPAYNGMQLGGYLPGHRAYGRTNNGMGGSIYP